MQTSRKKLMMK